jgi:two-component system, NtrC family, response regulator AtoC
VRLPDADGLEILERIRLAEADVPVIMITAHGGVESAVRAMKLGAYDYIIKPVNLDELKLTVKKALENRALRREVARFQAEQRLGAGLDAIVGTSGPTRGLRGVVQRIAQSDATTVLLEGESGTGKDLVARVIHFESARAQAPFLAVNCAALPEQLLESELLGHEKGAFTDAKALKKGLLEQADGGTLYLDEIGDMQLNLQAKLLRLIEEKSFRRVGGVRDLKVDVRIIAATNRDLVQALEAGEFRKDLYYRLRVFPVHLPSLRERPEDILPLARHFLAHFARDSRKRMIEGFAPQAEIRMSEHSWPGNVRELRNAIERAVIMTRGPLIDVEDLPHEIAIQKARGAELSAQTNQMTLEEVERRLIEEALEVTQGNQVRAARRLGITRDTLRYRMKKYGLGEAPQKGG